jgi:hypothetical protein
MENLHEQLEAIEDYTSVLEEALVALCEEMEIDPAALVEDIQTDERYQEMRIKGVQARSDAQRVRGRRDAEARKIRKAAADHDKQDSKEHRSKAVYAKGGRKITDPKEGKREMKASSKRFHSYLDREFKKGAAQERAEKARMSPYDRALYDAERAGYQGPEARRIAAERSRGG